MESRFRKFLYARRDKAPQTINTDLQDVPQRSASPQWPLTPSTGRTSLSATRERRDRAGNGTLLLSSVPYDTIAPGKTPIFTAEPVKGNGPVKLQTCRRLSTGELRPTTQDINKAMDNIREGDYIVGRKDTHRARDRSSTVVSSLFSPALSTSLSSSEPSCSPRTPPDSSAYPWSPSMSEHMEGSAPYSSATMGGGLGISSVAVNPLQTQSSQWHSSMARLTVASRSSYTSTATSPSVHIVEESNATIAALRKAEHNRLMDLQAREKSNNYQVHAIPTTPSRRRDQTADLGLDLPPRLNYQNDDLPRRTSNISSTGSQGPDDVSDTSSYKRASLISSIAGSSYTVQTSMTEYDATATRDDIRKLITEMRSTYIRALDSQSPPATKHKNPNKKKRRNKLGVPSTRVKPSTSVLERQTWHGNHASQRHSGLKHCIEATTVSRPTTQCSRLSPVEASPPQAEKRPVAHLQRADSSTLGSITSRLENGRAGGNLQSLSINRAQSKKREAGLFNIDYTLIEKGIDDSDAFLMLDESSLPSQTYTVRPVGNFI